MNASISRVEKIYEMFLLPLLQKVVMVDIATLLFRSYGYLRKKAAEVSISAHRHRHTSPFYELRLCVFATGSLICSFLLQLRVDRKRDNWCLDLATLLCAALPKDDLTKAVIDLGDNFGMDQNSILSGMNSCNSIITSPWSSHACFLFHLQPPKD